MPGPPRRSTSEHPGIQEEEAFPVDDTCRKCHRKELSIVHEYSTDQDGNHVTQENYIFVDAIENMPRETWATASREAEPEASSATKRSPTRPSSLTKTALFGTMLISSMSTAPSTQMPSANVAGTAAPHPASVEEPQHFYPPDEDDDGRGPRLQCSVCDWFIPAGFAYECATCREHFCYRTCGRFCNGRSGCNLHFCDDCWPSHKEEHHTEDDWSYSASSSSTAEEVDGDVETLSLLQRKISLVDARAAGASTRLIFRCNRDSVFQDTFF